MKTPWRFLAELTSRRKAAPEQIALPKIEANPEYPEKGAERLSLRFSVGNSGDARKIEEVLALPAAFSALPEPVAERSKALPVPPTVDGKIFEAVEAEPSPPVISGIASEPAEEVMATEPRISAPKVSDSAKSAEPAKGATAIKAGSGLDERSAPPRNPEPSDEVLDLDDEIRLMRAALAQKLSTQNDQLRKMLERFNVS